MGGGLLDRYVRSLYTFCRARLDGWLDPHAMRSYSQFGEDMLLRVIFKARPTGFYVDVGAHHPLRWSNTYFFYERGWRGLNVDAAPGRMRLFGRWRPRDINVEAAVGLGAEPLIFYEFDEPALSTLDAAIAQRRNQGRFRLVRETPLKVRPLAEVLAEHLPPGQAIDFLNVDCEGYDLSVLESNDWGRFRPDHVLVESFDLLHHQGLGPAGAYLASLGYTVAATALRTVVFRWPTAPLPNLVY